MSTVVVEVTYHGPDQPLTVVPDQISISAGDAVQWNFHGLSLDELAFIHFAPFGSEDLPFGPFDCLEPSSFHVFGIGNSGIPGQYNYTAMVLGDQGRLAKSESATSILNLAEEENASPGVQVEYDAASGQFTNIDPVHLHLQIGRPALWYITGVPQDQFFTFEFEGFQDVMVGPFASFLMTRGFGEARVAVASDFKRLGDGQEVVHYRIKVRDAEGTVVAVTDPIIDPIPWPPNS